MMSGRVVRSVVLGLVFAGGVVLWGCDRAAGGDAEGDAAEVAVRPELETTVLTVEGMT